MNYKHIEDKGFLHSGSIELVCGSMFSGKTEELIRRLRRAKIAGQSILIFKPETDTRYSEDSVVSHDRNSIPSLPISSASELYEKAQEAQVIGIDEAQFFHEELIEVVQSLADEGKRIIIAGLDMDFRRRPFGPMSGLSAIADSVDKIHAICVSCGRLANYSYRLVEGEEQVMLGEMKTYVPLCRSCYLAKQNTSSL